MNLEKAIETAKILFPTESWDRADYSRRTDCYFVLEGTNLGVMCLIIGDFKQGQLYLTNPALSRLVDDTEVLGLDRDDAPVIDPLACGGYNSAKADVEAVLKQANDAF